MTETPVVMLQRIRAIENEIESCKLPMLGKYGRYEIPRNKKDCRSRYFPRWMGCVPWRLPKSASAHESLPDNHWGGSPSSRSCPHNASTPSDASERTVRLPAPRLPRQAAPGHPHTRPDVPRKKEAVLARGFGRDVAIRQNSVSALPILISSGLGNSAKPELPLFFHFFYFLILPIGSDKFKIIFKKLLTFPLNCAAHLMIASNLQMRPCNLKSIPTQLTYKEVLHYDQVLAN